MRKIFLMLLLVSLNGSALAEWTRVTADKDGSAVYYADAASIQESADGLTTIWELNDLKEQDEDGTRSSKIHVEYDCLRERFRVLSVIVYSQNMGGGKVIVNLSPADIKHQPIPPDSAETYMWKVACGKK